MTHTPLSLPLNLIRSQPLSKISTLGIGGPSRYYIVVKTLENLQEALSFCSMQKVPVFILGKGSNCLFDDKGFDGCVIHNKIDHVAKDGQGRYHVGAGYSFSLLGTQTARDGFSGLEFASGIPGSVGGAVFMNAGANGSETKDCLFSVETVDLAGRVRTMEKAEIVFRYRYSSFQDLPYAITGATFTLTPSETARKKQIDLIQYRQKTQPYKDKSAGCIFKNPDGTSAGRLIEECGLKGFQIGNACVSPMHANFLVNSGNSTCEDFKHLVNHIKTIVLQKTGIDLHCEIKMIPFDFNPFKEPS